MNAQAIRTLRQRRKRVARAGLEAAVFLICAFVVAVSAYSMKRAHGAAELAALTPAERPASEPAPAVEINLHAPTDHGDVPLATATQTPVTRTPIEPAITEPRWDADVRWFDGRPVRPARVMWMTVTAYSPDWRSCGVWADGVTASGKTVHANAGELVAADTRLLPFGSLLTVPGYAEDRIVPVQDRGGAIKGMRLDVLYPTHGRARLWGVQRVPVTVWEYCD